ncbi:endonuclease domain-containing protein [Streptomyces sp. SP17KL33]|uniref:endonuclease domain-containing protein n=1 Tax=Streptomyces sp. SP17KL33 TaxID=3002534 RepID=UPI003FCE5296
MESKECPQCNEVKPLDAFGKCASRKDGLQLRCRACRNDNQKAADAQKRAENPSFKTEDGHRLQARKLGMSYEAFLEARQQPCQLCTASDEPSTAYTDRKTGALRGWICRKCSRGIGNFNHDVGQMRAAIKLMEC